METEIFMTNLLLVGVIFAQLHVYWQVKDITPKKRKYKHTAKFLNKNK